MHADEQAVLADRAAGGFGSEAAAERERLLAGIGVDDRGPRGRPVLARDAVQDRPPLRRVLDARLGEHPVQVPLRAAGTGVEREDPVPLGRGVRAGLPVAGGGLAERGVPGQAVHQSPSCSQSTAPPSAASRAIEVTSPASAGSAEALAPTRTVPPAPSRTRGTPGVSRFHRTAPSEPDRAATPRSSASRRAVSSTSPFRPVTA